VTANRHSPASNPCASAYSSAKTFLNGARPQPRNHHFPAA
jgi:hypothetical protein